MKLHIILGMVMAFFLTKTQAQKITWGDTKKDNTLANNYRPIGFENGKTFIYHGKFSGVTTFDGEFKGIIDVYDADMKLESSVELEKKKKGQKGKDVSEVENAVWTKDNILIIRSKYDKSSDTKTLFTQTYDRAKSIANPTEKKFGELASTKKFKTAPITITSEDKTKILVYSELEKIKGEPSEYIFYILDTDGELLWKRQTTFGKSSDTRYQDIEISNSGVVYAVISELDSKDKLEAISVCYLDENERNDKSHKIEPTYDLSFTRFNLELAPTGSVAYASFHRDGCFYEELDAKLSKSISKKEFDINKLSETMNFESNREVKSKKIGNELKIIDVVDFTFHKDGSKTIIGQFYNKKVVTSGAGADRTTQTTWYYYDLMIVNFDTSGEIAWCKRIPKRHVAMNSNKYVNVTIADFDDNILIFYNDHVDNFETGIADQNVRVKEAETLKVTITPEGDITKETLFTGNDTKLLLDVWDSGQVSEDYLFLTRRAPVKGMTGLDKMSFGLLKF